MAKICLQFIFGALLGLFSFSAGAATLNYGKYFGTLQMEGQPEPIAVSLDAFVVQLHDAETYPALDVIMRVNLGGYSSSEYAAFHFHAPTFNFEKGILQLNDPQQDLTATLQVTNTDEQTILEGPVTHRLANTKGTLRVVMNLDDETNPAPVSNALSTLKGEYQGKCGKDSALLQIETARGHGAEAPGNALTGFSITGRLGFTNGPICFPDRTNQFCSQYPYSTGAYSPFTGRLTMQGPIGSLDCVKKGDGLECKVFGYDKNRTCLLQKPASSPTPAVQIPSTLFLDVPAEQKKPLPGALPPVNEDLLNALNGTFYGFLHFENRDVYQLMEMGLVATTSTENPHNENQVVVTPTILLRLGSSWNSTPVLSLAYPQRVFGMNQGFAFEEEAVDDFLVINDWRSGYVKGTLYSRSYGRVGTFELRKDSRPEIPAHMALLPDLSGFYRGPADSPNPYVKNVWSLSIELPGQVSKPGQTGLSLLARIGGPGVMQTPASASFDPASGLVSFLMRDDRGDRLVTGEMAADGNLKLLWPPGPALGAPMSNYRPFTYHPADGAP